VPQLDSRDPPIPFLRYRYRCNTVDRCLSSTAEIFPFPS
jgi:hypothetical protein